MDEINTSHDAFFKSMLDNKKFRNGFFKQHLPKNILKLIELGSLKKLSESFINANLKSSYADYILEANLKGDKKAVICFLIEHKSQPQMHTAIQVFYYIASAYYDQVVKNKGSLKLIIPIIYYHGKRNWDYKPLHLLFSTLPEELKIFIPKFDTIFINLQNYSDQEIESWHNDILSIASFLQKNAFNKEILMDKIGELCEKIDLLDDRNLIYDIFVYLLNHSEAKENQILDIIEDLNQKKYFMSTLQMIEQRGEIMGKTQKQEQVIVNAYKQGLDIKLIGKISELSVQKVKAILKEKGLL
jgi:predicted transposase/invertase (TIGR01784 family)